MEKNKTAEKISQSTVPGYMLTLVLTSCQTDIITPSCKIKKKK